MRKILLGLFLLGAAPVGAQEAKNWIQNYLDQRFSGEISEKDWYLEVDGVRLPKKPLSEGLDDLDKKMQERKLSKGEQKALRAQFVQNYTDRMILFIKTYKMFLEEPDLDSVLLELLAQASSQRYLQRQLEKNPEGVQPTEADIDRYLKEHAARFRRLGLGAAAQRDYASMELEQTKMQQWTAQQVAELKTQAKVQTNKAVRKELGL